MTDRVLVVAPQPVFTDRGTPFSVYHRMVAAAKLGVHSDLLTYAEGADPDIPGLRVVRVPRLPFVAPPKVGPSLGKIVRDVFMVLWTVALLVRHRHAVVHAHEEAVFWCRWLKPIFGFRLIYDMHSSLPQQLENFGYTRSRVLIGLFRGLEEKALRDADAIVTICPDLASYAVERMSDPSKHVMIENSNLEAVRLVGSETAAGPAAEPISVPADRPVVLYAGTFEAYQGVDLLLEGFSRVGGAPKPHLVMVGGRPDQVEAARRKADALGLSDRVTVRGRIPQSEVRRLYHEVAAVVSPRTRGTNTPLKIYEILAAGVPLVATDIRSHTQVLDPSICFLVPPDPEGMAEGLAAALTPGGFGPSRAQAGRLRYHERYSDCVYLDRMDQLLRRVGLETALPNDPRAQELSARAAIPTGRRNRSPQKSA